MASILDLLGPSSGLASLAPQQGVNPALAIYARNLSYAKPGDKVNGYLTKLNPVDELAFQQWVKKNNIPFDPSSTADYDMRGFWKAQMNNDPRAQTGVNAQDGLLHFTDYFKTPYHQSFSVHSKWATADAPDWKGDDLVDKNGNVIFSDAANAQKTQWLQAAGLLRDK